MRLDFGGWLRLSEAHLYHGTTTDNERSIRSLGLVPGVGHFVQDAYGDDTEEYGVELPELVFATDRREIDKALNAMVSHIGKKLGKAFHDVTNNDIRNHGLLVVIDDGSEDMQQRPREDDRWGEHPHTVEPGDYYSDERVHATRFVKGPALIRLMTRMGALPRTWGPEDPKQLNKIRGAVTSWAINRKSSEEKPEVLKQALQAPQAKMNHYYALYRRPTE